MTELVEVDEFDEIIQDGDEGGEEGSRGRERRRRKKGTEYICWETFGGLLGPVVRLAVGGTLRERFGEYAEGLRGFCEGGDGKVGDGDGEGDGGN